jgi:hypothetical protein
LKADSKEAMKAIENQLSTLKENFKNLGVEVNKIDVNMTTEDENQQYNNLSNNSTSDENNNQKSKREFVESLRMLSNMNNSDTIQENIN